MKNLILFCFVVACLALNSCSSSSESDICIPFQSSSGGRWGMLSNDGSILFEEEFNSKPTIARNGRFIVSNANDEYEIYTASDKPKQVGEAYKDIVNFTSDVTVSVKKDEKINIY